MTLEQEWAEYETRNDWVNRVARAEQPICGAIIPPTKIREHQVDCEVCKPIYFRSKRAS